MSDKFGKAIENIINHVYHISQLIMKDLVYSAILFITSFLYLIYLGGGGIVSIVLTGGFIVYLIYLTYQFSSTFMKKTTTNTINAIEKRTGDAKKAIERKTNNAKDAIDKALNINRKEVYNIPGNSYTYDDARLVCQALNADLATYDQVESAYNKGGEWCNYGWSEGQMALFPIQKKTHSKMQTIKGHENDCGRPGVNGGYFDDKELQFGVNCYGIKPKMNKSSQKIIEATTFFPQSEQDLQMKMKVDQLKMNIKDIIISPFNQDKWKQI
jgi:hypothetical protein